MKAFFITLAYVAFANLNAQVRHFEFGLTGGAGISSITNLAVDPELAPSYAVYGVFHTNITQHFAFVLLPGFDQKGIDVTSNVRDQEGNVLGEYTSKFRYNFLTMPVLLQGQWGGKTSFFVNGGGYAALLLGANVEDDYLNQEQDITEGYNPIDFGLTAGFGLRFTLANPWLLTAEVRGNYGLVDIFESSISQDPSVHWNALFLVGVRYGFGERAQ